MRCLLISLEGVKNYHCRPHFKFVNFTKRLINLFFILPIIDNVDFLSWSLFIMFFRFNLFINYHDYFIGLDWVITPVVIIFFIEAVIFIIK